MSRSITFNAFHGSVPCIYPLRTLKSRWVFYIFRGYRNKALTWKGLITEIWVSSFMFFTYLYIMLIVIWPLDYNEEQRLHKVWAMYHEHFCSTEVDFSSIRDLINPSMITEEIPNWKLHFSCSASFHFPFSYCV